MRSHFARNLTLCFVMCSTFLTVWPHEAAASLHYRTIFRRAYVYPTNIDVPSTFSEGGKLFASIASMDGSAPLRLWNTHTGKLIRSFAISNVQSVVFSPDSRKLAVITGQRGRYGVDEGFSIQLLDTRTGASLRTFVKAGSVQVAFYTLAFSGDGKLLAAGSGDGLVRVWNVATGRRFVTLRQGGFVESLVFVPRGRMLAALSRGYNDNCDLRLWNVASKKLLRSTSVGGNKGTLAFTPDGRQLVVNSVNNRVRFYKVSRFKVLRELPPFQTLDDEGGEYEEASQIVLSMDGRRLAFIRNDYITVRSAAAPRQIIARYSAGVKDQFRGRGCNCLAFITNRS